MMKHLPWIYVFLIMALALAGCETYVSTSQPTPIMQLSPSAVVTPTIAQVPTEISPASTLTLTPIPTATPALLDTLEPDKAREMIKARLQGTADCAAPCFWGIIPGQTSLDEARNIFSYLGLQMTKDFFEIDYDFLSISLIFTIQNNIIENLRVRIHPEQQKPGTVREWSAYSQETLIKRYGIPTRVDLMQDWSPNSIFAMIMYFDDVDLIVEYVGNDIMGRAKGSARVCPLTAQFELVRLWMGKNPVYPPGKGISIEKATSITIEEFSKLMAGDHDQACFIVNGDVFQ
jgi:hypothetical protein